MKKILPVLLALLAVVMLFAACQRGKNTEEETDPNAVLTDSDVPLDLGAQLIEDDTDPTGVIYEEKQEAQSITEDQVFSEIAMP